jgi:hypothetical protein
MKAAFSCRPGFFSLRLLMAGGYIQNHDRAKGHDYYY